MSVNLNNLANNVSGLTLANAYTAGSGSFTLTSGGSLFPAAPCRMTVITAATYQTSSETLTIYEVTGIAGSVITVSGAIEGTTDRNYAVGDKVDLRLTAGSVNDLNTAVTPLIETVAATGSNQGGAAALAPPGFYATEGFHLITATGANQGVVLPAITAVGHKATIINTSIYAIDVYPNGSQTINGGSASAAATIPAGGTSTLIASTTTNWQGVGSGPRLGATAFSAQGGAVVNATYTVPPGATTIRMIGIAAGSGGGAGGVGGNSTFGGNGGGSGAYSEFTYLASLLPATLTINVGAGGTAGAGGTGATGASGGAGSSNTTVTNGAVTYLFAACSTPGGGGGGSAAGAVSLGSNQGLWGGANSPVATAGNAPGGSSAVGLGAGAGGGGGGISSGGVAGNGGAGSHMAFGGSGASGGAGGAGVASGTPNNGGNGGMTSGNTTPMYGAGGAGGGGANSGGSGGNGGNGGFPGGGAGGGGAGFTGNSSGSGGAGGGGIIVMIAS